MSKKVIGIIFIVLLFAVGVSFYYFVYATDEKKISRAINNIENLNSFTTNTELKLKTINDKGSSNIQILAETDKDIVNESEKGNFVLKSDYTVAGLNLGFDFSGEIMAVKNKIFFKIKSLPEMFLIFLPKEFTDTITGKWIFLESDNLFDYEEFKNTIENININLWREKIVSIKGKEKDIIDGKSLNKYELSFELNEFINFIEIEISPLLLKEGNAFGQVGEEEKKEFIKNLKNIKNIKGYLWTDGKYIYQNSIELEIYLEDESSNEMFIYLKEKYSNFNESFKIESPEEYINYEELEEMLQKGMSPLLFPSL